MTSNRQYILDHLQVLLEGRKPQGNIVAMVGADAEFFFMAVEEAFDLDASLFKACVTFHALAETLEFYLF